MNDVADRQLPIPQCRQSGCVLAARLGEEIHVRLCAQQVPGGIRTAGENDGVHLRVGDQAGAGKLVGAGDHLQRPRGNAGPPETAAQFMGHQHGVRGGL